MDKCEAVYLLCYATKIVLCVPNVLILHRLYLVNRFGNSFGIFVLSLTLALALASFQSSATLLDLNHGVIKVLLRCL